MPTPRTIVTFQSTAFNTTQPQPYFINPCCFGDDIARWLITQLHSQNIPTNPAPGQPPRQEDFGWYFYFTVEATKYRVIIGLRPADGPDPTTWIAFIDGKPSLRTLFTKPANPIPATQLIHTILTVNPQITDIQWHTRADFDAGNETNAATEPA